MITPLQDALNDNAKLPADRQRPASQIKAMVRATARVERRWDKRDDLPTDDEKIAMQALGRAIYRRMHRLGFRTELGVHDATAIKGQVGPSVDGAPGHPVPIPDYEGAPRMLRYRAVLLAEKAVEAALANVDAWHDIWLREESVGVPDDPDADTESAAA